MVASSGYDTYRSQYYDGMDPKRLILMLYDGAIKFLKLTRLGIEENNIVKRGENLGRAISVISELHASIDPNMNDESTVFLRGLYTSILLELPKVAVSNDIKIIDTALRYINGLREIWIKSVMKNESKTETELENRPIAPMNPNTGYGKTAATGLGRSFSA